MNIPLNIDWQQILLHMLNLVILFAIMYFLLYKPIKAFMDKRADYYRDLDEKAKSKLAESEQLKAEYEQKLVSAEEEIAANKAKAMKEASKSRQEMLDGAKAQGDEIIATAKKKAAEEHDRILSETQKEITDMIAVATSKIVGGEDVSDSFDTFLKAAGK